MGDTASKPTEAELKMELAKEHKLPTSVFALDITKDAKHAFAACFDGGIYRVDLESGKHEKIGQHDSYASGAWLLEEKQVLITAGYDGTLRWHDLAAGKLIRTVQAHRFWSWKMAVSPDQKLAASVTGQYNAGGYKYEPAAEQEPSVRVFDAATGELRHSFAHVPPVLSTAFSPDSRYLAAGNMMGEVRVWDLRDGKQVSSWTTSDFTSWGIIKSHHYIGGIYGMTFAPDGNELLVCGMGPMNDPMAGNGKQTWQRFAWKENPARKTTEIADGDRGNGLMESIEFHPSHQSFLMAGRLAQGKWNAALFAADTGKLLYSIDTKTRVTDVVFDSAGRQVFLAGTVGQEKKKDGKLPDFGRIKIYKCTV